MSDALNALLKLHPAARADLAMALWQSLSDEERAAALEVSPELARELDRRWAAHETAPETAVPWEELRRQLRG